MGVGCTTFPAASKSTNARGRNKYVPYVHHGMWHFCVRKEGNSVSERRAPTMYPNVGPTHCGDTNFVAQMI